MSEHGHLRSGVTKAVSNYLGTRNGAQLVTTSDAIRHVRTQFPSLKTSDRFLADIVAGQAIILGLGVEIDGGPNRRAIFDRWPKASTDEDKPQHDRNRPEHFSDFPCVNQKIC